MELLLIEKSDDQLYTDMFWKLLSYIPDEIKMEYKYFYDELINHLINDSKNFVLKNMRKDFSKERKLTYKIEVFKKHLHHIFTKILIKCIILMNILK